MNNTQDQSGSKVLPADLVALKRGQMIGRYQIVSVLGQGGFGITYRARDNHLERDVAIKEYLPLALAVRQDGTTVLPRSSEAAGDFSWGRDRFVAEGRTLANLQRAPAIVRVYDFLESNGTAYIVMELLGGETLGQRLSKGRTLAPAEVGRILWPLLDGLEQIHNAGFLHRDIKPANILLDLNGNPTLIDFGASRAAVAGHNAVLTAVFTPGYAAPEQMASARQGPWTDIYGLAATLRHAIAGTPPPSAFDRMQGDAYEPLAKMAVAGFPVGLLAGIDAGLAVKVSDRPQSIAGWRPLLAEGSAVDADVTVLMSRPARSVRAADASPPRTRPALWIGGAAAALLTLAGGYYVLLDEIRLATGRSIVDEAGQQTPTAAEVQHLKDQEELARLRADAVERQKALADDQARQKALEDQRNAEVSLRLTSVDRQRIQIALTSLGFDTRGTDGALGARSREMIGAWQQARNLPATGFLDGKQRQALLGEATAALNKHDDEQRKLEEKTQRIALPPPASPPPQLVTVHPRHAADGFWEGFYQCQAAQVPAYGAPFSIPFRAALADGRGIWMPPAPRETKSISLQVAGDVAQFVRVAQHADLGAGTELRLSGRFDGETITASGREQLAGRVCSVTLRRGASVGSPSGRHPN